MLSRYKRLLPSLHIIMLARSCRSAPTQLLPRLASWAPLASLPRTLASAMQHIASPGPRTRLLFCGFGFPTALEYTREYLRAHPYIQVDVLAHEDVRDKIEDYDICVVRMMRIDSQVIARAKRMKLFVQFGMGLEGVDIKSATEAGIKVARIPSHGTGNALSCSEHAIYLILGLLRDQNGLAKSIQEKKLGEPVGKTLYGRTVFIVGYGNIGRELALRLKAFGVRILATKRSWNLTSNIANLVDEKGGPGHLLQFASQADVVVTCCSLTSETAGMVNEKFLAALKKGALLVNIARGGLLDYDAVKKSLEANHLGGLGIDVAWFEPFDPADPLLQHPKVLITPHIAGVTEMSYRNMSKVIADSAIQLHAGGEMQELEFVN